MTYNIALLKYSLDIFEKRFSVSYIIRLEFLIWVYIFMFCSTIDLLIYLCTKIEFFIKIPMYILSTNTFNMKQYCGYTDDLDVIIMSGCVSLFSGAGRG